MDQLMNFLHSVHPMPPDLEQHLRSILKYREFSKKEYLLKAGRVCENVYFIKEGLLRCYYINKEREEVCSWFMKEGDVVYAVKSFLTQTASYESIQALENCRAYYITYKELHYIYRNYLTFNVHRGELTERYYLLSEERSFSMRRHNAQERYDYLLDKHPELIQRIPLQYIASYIGVSTYSMKRSRAKK